jgi:hypothetical protein
VLGSLLKKVEDSRAVRRAGIRWRQRRPWSRRDESFHPTEDSRKLPAFLIGSQRQNVGPANRFLPQQIASAIGFHIAMTTGDRTRLSVELTSSWPVLLCDSALPSLMKAAEEG